MDIGEISKLSGIAASALRYYEKVGLIRSSSRKGLRRQYHSSVLERLALIALGRHAGFSLEEISSMLKGPKEKIQIDRSKLKAKARELDKKIARLTAVREGLLHASTCKAPNHLECPKFKRLMKIALAKPL